MKGLSRLIYISIQQSFEFPVMGSVMNSSLKKLWQVYQQGKLSKK